MVKDQTMWDEDEEGIKEQKEKQSDQVEDNSSV
jgi:hypothetical protein